MVRLKPTWLLAPGQLDYLKANKAHFVKELELEVKKGVHLE